MQSSELDSPVAKFQGTGDKRVDKIKYDKESERVYINNDQYFDGTVPPNVHDLAMLCKIANGINDVSIDSGLLNNLPSHREAIRRRYGEGDPVTVKQAILNYGDTLIALKSFTEALSRQFIMKNAKFLIQVPPWEQ